MARPGPRGMGSSPLTRGKHVAHRIERREVGLIPAHAGKTARASISGQRHWAHPRSRGENQLGKRRVEGVKGSSPLTRGKHGRSSVLELTWGLIPAHAGKTNGYGC